MRSTESIVASRGEFPPPGQPVVAAEGRLRLLEHLLPCEQLRPCAAAVVEWLVDQAGAVQAAYLAVDSTTSKLRSLASAGRQAAELSELELDPARNGRFLSEISDNQAPTFLPSPPRLPGGCFSNRPIWAARIAVPQAEAMGFLLVGLPRAEGEVVDWAAGILRVKLAHFGSEGALTDRQLRRERVLLHSVINSVPDPVLLTDTEGKLIVANQRAEKLFASREDESEGRRRAVAMNNMLFTAALSSQAVDRSDPSRNELLLVDPTDGSDLLFELISSSIRELDSQTGIVSVLRNITELGQASQQIEESFQKLSRVQAEAKSERHRLDLIIDSVADPIIVTDAAGDIVMMNHRAERLFSPSARADVAVQRRVRANDAHFSSFISNLFFSGEDLKWRGEINLVDPATGVPMPVEAVAGKVLTERGELSTVVTILHDLTEAREKAQLYEQLKQASGELEAKVQAATAELAHQNELLRRQAIQLEQASAAKTLFLANMSHEFRTPLNAILGYSAMLLQGVNGPITEQQQKNLTRIDANGRHLLQIINEILDISRIEAGRMPFQSTRFKLPELIAEVLSELEPIIQRSKLPVKTQLQAGLPPVSTDRQKVKQIVLNLLSNALKFTHEGWIRIDARCHQGNNTVTISVTDTGIGIAEKDLEKIFEDFQQADNSPTRAYGGTGLGLSICRRLARMLGGDVTVESKLGKGSTFMLQFPRTKRR